MVANKSLTVWLLVFGLIINFDKTLMSLIVQVLQKNQGWSPADAGDLLAVQQSALGYFLGVNPCHRELLLSM